MKEEGGGVAFLVCDPHTHTRTPRSRKLLALLWAALSLRHP